MRELEVCAGIIYKDNEFLIGKRQSWDRYGGKWEFPGGKVEEGELPEDCIVRELREELAITVDAFEHFFSYVYRFKDVSLIIHAFIVNNYSGIIKRIEHDEIAWVKLEDLDKFDMLQGDIPIIEKLLNEKA